jgi:hypothetical protein
METISRKARRTSRACHRDDLLGKPMAASSSGDWASDLIRCEV